MTTPDYSSLRTQHRRELRGHVSDRRWLVLGFASVMVLLTVVVTAVAVMWP